MTLWIIFLDCTHENRSNEPPLIIFRCVLEEQLEVETAMWFGWMGGHLSETESYSWETLLESICC